MLGLKPEELALRLADTKAAAAKEAARELIQEN